MPQGQRSAARAARSAAGCMLLHAAGLIPPGAEAGDAGGADDPPLADADEDSSAEDGDPADGEVHVTRDYVILRNLTSPCSPSFL